ncbi:MAG: hypothetical protein AB4080_08860 [Trichodesmium sp.]
MIQKQQLSNIATWMTGQDPKDLPEVLQGVFFMDGNSLPDDCINMYNSEWDSENLTLSLRVFAPIQWTFHDSIPGIFLIYSIKLFRITYEFHFDDENLKRADIIPILLGFRIPKFLLKFLIERDDNTPNGDIWYRRNVLFGSYPGGGYTLRRIVDRNGEYLMPAFSDMLSKVNNDCLVITQD